MLYALYVLHNILLFALYALNSAAFGIIQFDVYALKSIRFDKYKGMVENNDVFKA